MISKDARSMDKKPEEMDSTVLQLSKLVVTVAAGPIPRLPLL
jgi:hypothetical protein